MLFHVTTEFDADRVPGDELAGLLEQERDVARRLQREGVILQLFREEGTRRAIGIWQAPDVTTLDAAFHRLPCAPYMDRRVVPVVIHPNQLGRSGYRSPQVRLLTRRHGIDAAALAGTGRGGRVSRDDVLIAIGSRRAPMALGEVILAINFGDVLSALSAALSGVEIIGSGSENSVLPVPVSPDSGATLGFSGPAMVPHVRSGGIAIGARVLLAVSTGPLWSGRTAEELLHDASAAIG